MGAINEAPKTDNKTEHIKPWKEKEINKKLEKNLENYLCCGHLGQIILYNVSESITSNGTNTKGWHNDREILTSFEEFTKDCGRTSERPVSFKCVPQSQWAGKITKKKVWNG